jgi:aspyridone synthetase trans-acting enoyl reductase
MYMIGNTLSPDDGAFAEYVVAKAHALIHLPKSLSPELGSTLPTALFTAGFCLYRHLSLAYPGEAEAIQSTQPVVYIYGGGTAIGSMQGQLAKLYSSLSPPLPLDQWLTDPHD